MIDREKQEVWMKKHTSTGKDDIRPEILDEALCTLPRRELPSHVEERILSAVRNLKPERSGARSSSLKGLQLAALTAGACVFVSLGALMAWTLTRTEEPVLRGNGAALDSYDPSLIDYLDGFGG